MFPRNSFLNSIYIKTLAAVLIIFTSHQALSLKSDASSEITIQSDTAEFDRKTGIAIYSGNVILEQGTLLIEADKITLYSDQQQQLEKAIAVGKPARFQQQTEADKGLTKARGQTITYLTQDKSVVLSKDAFLEQEESSFKGDLITYDIVNESIKAKGQADTSGNNETNDEQPRGRIKMIIQPAKTAEVAK